MNFDVRRELDEAQSAQVEGVLERSAEEQGRMHDTADHREALAALFEKRRPHFTGR